jgi:hypothetical protein
MRGARRATPQGACWRRRWRWRRLPPSRPWRPSRSPSRSPCWRPASRRCCPRRSAAPAGGAPPRGLRLHAPGVPRRATAHRCLRARRPSVAVGAAARSAGGPPCLLSAAARGEAGAARTSASHCASAAAGLRQHKVRVRSTRSTCCRGTLTRARAARAGAGAPRAADGGAGPGRHAGEQLHAAARARAAARLHVLRGRPRRPAQPWRRLRRRAARAGGLLRAPVGVCRCGRRAARRALWRPLAGTPAASVGVRGMQQQLMKDAAVPETCFAGNLQG